MLAPMSTDLLKTHSLVGVVLSCFREDSSAGNAGRAEERNTKPVFGSEGKDKKN